jgi:hypothetical protein
VCVWILVLLGEEYRGWEAKKNIEHIMKWGAGNS